MSILYQYYRLRLATCTRCELVVPGPTRRNGRRSCPALPPWPEELPAQQSAQQSALQAARRLAGPPKAASSRDGQHTPRAGQPERGFPHDQRPGVLRRALLRAVTRAGSSTPGVCHRGRVCEEARGAGRDVRRADVQGPPTREAETPSTRRRARVFDSFDLHRHWHRHERHVRPRAGRLEMRRKGRGVLERHRRLRKQLLQLLVLLVSIPR